MSKTSIMIEKWISESAERNKEIISILLDAGMDRDSIEKELKVKVSKPVKIESIPTFDINTSRPVSPMLHERFSVVGTIKDGVETWLSGNEMATAVKSKKVLKILESLRLHWEGSVPQRFSANQLGVFGLQPDQPENITFLAWEEDVVEPLLVRFNGQNESIYKDLDHFLSWATS